VVRGRRGTADDAVKVLAAKRASAAAAAAAVQPPAPRRAQEDAAQQPKQQLRARSATDDYPAKAAAKATSRRSTADEVRPSRHDSVLLSAPLKRRTPDSRSLHSEEQL